MEFTYDGYARLLSLLQSFGYEIADYVTWETKRRCAILRHDIDCDLDQAVSLAQFEQSRGVMSTWFVLVTSDFYNIFSAENRKKLQNIIACGGQIGLHFDETAYEMPAEEGFAKALCEKIRWEVSLLEQIIESPIQAVSMHRPSRQLLGGGGERLRFNGLINVYGSPFFDEFKYLSDSRRNWRESVEEIIVSNQYDRLQILTHAFWYHETEKSLHDTIKTFVNGANQKQYDTLFRNITDLASIMKPEEVCQ